MSIKHFLNCIISFVLCLVCSASSACFTPCAAESVRGGDGPRSQGDRVKKEPASCVFWPLPHTGGCLWETIILSASQGLGFYAPAKMAIDGQIFGRPSDAHDIM